MPCFQAGILSAAVHIIRNLRLFVHLSSDAVPHKLPHNRKAVGDHVALHCTANIEQPVARPGFSIANSSDSRVTSINFSRFGGDLAHRHGNRRIAVVSV